MSHFQVSKPPAGVDFYGHANRGLQMGSNSGPITVNNFPYQDWHGYSLPPLEEIRKLVSTTTATIEARVPCRLIPFKKNPRFFPRPAVMSQIEEHLEPTRQKATPDFRAFLLHGLGGVGKTQVATHYVYTHWNDYDVILWIGADSGPKMAEGYQEALQALGLVSGSDQAGARAVLNRWLSETTARWLLVFDNADDPSVLWDYWPHSASGRILVTSRDAMRDINLITRSCEIETMEKTEGSKMLLKMLEMDYRNISIPPEALAIAEELAGLPLAITQMAGFILKTNVSLTDFLSMWRESGQAERLLRSPTNPDRLQYQYTVETVFKVSFRRLNPDARALLHICVFLDPDEIPERLFLDGGRALPPSHAKWLKDRLSFSFTIGDLLNLSLLRKNARNSIVSLHRLVQSSAQQELTSAGGDMMAHSLAQATQLLYTVFPRQSPLGEPIPDWPTCEIYTKHVLQLHKVYLKECEGIASPQTMRLLTELFCDCGVYLWARGLYVGAESLAKTSIRIADRVLEAHDCLRAQPYTLLGCVYLRTENKLAEAQDCLMTALRIREENLRIEYPNNDAPLEVDIQLANAYSNLGIANKQALEFEKAADLHYKSLQIKRKYPETEMPFLFALSYHNLGKVRRLQGRLAEATELFQKGVELMNSPEPHMQHRKATFLYSLGDIAAMGGKVKDAEAHLTTALRLQKDSIGEALDTGLTYHRLGVLFFDGGHFKSAKLLFEQAVRVFSQPHLLSNAKLARSRFWLALACRAQGDEIMGKEQESMASSLFEEITGNKVLDELYAAKQQYEQIVLDD